MSGERLRLAVVGNGRMGKEVIGLAPERGCEVTRIVGSTDNPEATALTSQRLENVDVAIEFTNASAAPGNLRALAASGIPTVSGTTGVLDELSGITAVVLKSGSALVWGPNFSLGANLFGR